MQSGSQMRSLTYRENSVMKAQFFSVFFLSGLAISPTTRAADTVDFSKYMQQSSSLSMIAAALSVLDCQVPVEFEEKADTANATVELTVFCPETDNESGATIRFLTADDILLPDGFSFFP